MSVTKLINEFIELHEVLIEHENELTCFNSDPRNWNTDSDTGYRDTITPALQDRLETLSLLVRQQDEAINKVHQDLSQMLSDIEDLGSGSPLERKVLAPLLFDTEKQLDKFFSEYPL